MHLFTTVLHVLRYLKACNLRKKDSISNFFLKVLQNFQKEKHVFRTSLDDYFWFFLQLDFGLTHFGLMFPSILPEKIGKLADFWGFQEVRTANKNESPGHSDERLLQISKMELFAKQLWFVFTNCLVLNLGRDLSTSLASHFLILKKVGT